MIRDHPQSGIRGTKEVIYDTIAGGNFEKVLRREGEVAYSYSDREAWAELPKTFAEGRRGEEDKKARLEFLDEAFAHLLDE